MKALSGRERFLAASALFLAACAVALLVLLAESEATVQQLNQQLVAAHRQTSIAVDQTHKQHETKP